MAKVTNISGTLDYKKRKENKENVELRERSIPAYEERKFECPEILNIAGKQKWNELVKIITSMKQSPITDADKDQMLLYCQAWADYEYFDKEIRKRPDIYLLLPKPNKDGITVYTHIKNRNYDLRKQAADILTRCGSNLCLDVISRARVGLARVKAEQDMAESSFAKLLNRGDDE